MKDKFRHCLVCDKRFEYEADHARYCGNACRMKFHAVQKKESARKKQGYYLSRIKVLNEAGYIVINPKENMTYYPKQKDSYCGW